MVVSQVDGVVEAVEGMDLPLPMAAGTSESNSGPPVVEPELSPALLTRVPLLPKGDWSSRLSSNDQ